MIKKKKKRQNEWERGQAIFHSSNENTPKSGVAILVNAKQIYIEHLSSDLKGRILAIKLFYFDKQIQIINIYAPSGTSNRVENRIFFEKLYPYIISNIPVVLAGDFNCVENNELDKHPPIRAYEKPVTLIALKHTFNLIDTHRTQNPTTVTFTRHAPNSQSRLDRFYINNLCTFSNHKFLATPFADHDRVYLTLNTNHTCIKIKDNLEKQYKQ